VNRLCAEEYSAHPVFLSADESQAFYDGFCNQTLWPLFHYFPSQVSYDDDAWASYQHINEVFGDAVLAMAKPGDIVWVHDYHLLLLPALLRRRSPQLRVGFFLHIPFPAHEVFRLLPERWRSAILHGLLGADLIGFHTHDYTQHFLSCLRRILGYEHNMGHIALTDRLVTVDTFPMGVEFEVFTSRAHEPMVVRQQKEFRQSLAQCRAILSVDRLDYTKGIANRLLGYQVFLEAHPQWRGKVALVMIVVPSRTTVPEYQKMKSRVDELVGAINGKFGTLTWTPVVYQYKAFPQHDLVPLYGACDVMLVTPLRDGMNLVAKEYVASRVDGTGVLILSEMAGAACELGEAITVNPNDIGGLAQALREALEMPAVTQEQRMASMRDRLRRYDVVRWAGEFFDTLKESAWRLGRRLLAPAVRAQLVSHFRAAHRRLILCDYDGTLVPLQATPEQAQPGNELLGTLGQLARLAEVVIVSGRPRLTLEAWFGSLDVSLVAEHGAWIRERGQDWTGGMRLGGDWKPEVEEFMERYVDLLPGAFVEKKECTLAWHYRRADPELGSRRARELVDHLSSLTRASDLKVVEGNKVIEIRPSGVSKASACQRFLSPEYDFVVAIGDDTTDEDLFKALPATAYSIRVGLAPSSARFHVLNQSSALELVEALATSRDGNEEGTVSHAYDAMPAAA
jgi:trehalose 6-phosphate synthase/phosphatase